MIDDIRKLAGAASAGAGPSPAGTQPSGDAQPKGNLMVVDDQPANLKLLEDLLTQQGHAVRSFPRGRLALDAAARNQPDLILLDINLGGFSIDGWEVNRRLKADPATAGIPVIALTAHTQRSEHREHALQEGFVEHVSKPFNYDQLIEQVMAHLPETPK